MLKKRSTSTKKGMRVKKGLSKTSRTSTKDDSFEFTLSKIAEYIRTRAYYIWEDMGKPVGKDIEIWQTAEREILKKLIKK